MRPATAHAHASQRGAALIVGLVMLMVLTVLAISAMPCACRTFYSNLEVKGSPYKDERAWDGQEVQYHQRGLVTQGRKRKFGLLSPYKQSTEIFITAFFRSA